MSARDEWREMADRLACALDDLRQARDEIDQLRDDVAYLTKLAGTALGESSVEHIKYTLAFLHRAEAATDVPAGADQRPVVDRPTPAGTTLEEAS